MKRVAIMFIMAILAIASVQAMDLEPGEPATNPFQKNAAAKETVTAVPAATLQVSNPAPSTPLVAKNGAATVATAFLEANPSTEAPVPPAGAVKSATQVAATVPKKDSKAATAAKAAAYLAGLQKESPKAQLKLSTKWLEKIQSRLDAIRDAQDAAPKAAEKQDRIRNRAAKLIARQIQKVLEKSAATLKRAEEGKLSKADVDALAVGKKAAAGVAVAAGKTAKKADLKGANSLLPPGFKAPKAPSENSKASFSYSNHANNPKHKLKSRKHKKLAVPPQLQKSVAPPRFQQLPVGVVGDGHNEMLLKTVDAVMSLDNPSRNYKGHVSEEGKLCPTCNEIKYNANSPLSEEDKRLLVKTHSDLSLGGVKLHSQDTLDRATLMVDDAENLRKTMLDKYPVQNSLIQFDVHN